MQVENIALIAAIEVAAVLLVFCMILLYQNRSLRKLIKKLQARMTEMVEDFKATRGTPEEEASSKPVEEEPEPPSREEFLAGLLEHINSQLEETREHHASLDPDQDIVLDLSPETDLPRRAAALRYTMLLSEKEVISSAMITEEPINWTLLEAKYQQIFEFYEDYTPGSGDGASSEELDALNQELLNAKKRINNLEKFKTLYFELEEKWEKSKQDAQVHYNNLSEMASEVEDTEKFETALNKYHESYHSIDTIIQKGSDNFSTIVEVEKITDEKTAGELRHLRMITADQHKIIQDLEEKLRNANSDEERNQIVEGLKGELDKQKRFMQESETCIQLMEDELNNAHKELDLLKGRLKGLPSLKEQMQELKKQKDEFELKVYALTSENRKLTKKMKEDQGSLVIDNGETSRLKKELADLESRYASLEEKYLDLKISQ